jgi:hypothetical protein
MVPEREAGETAAPVLPYAQVYFSKICKSTSSRRRAEGGLYERESYAARVVAGAVPPARSPGLRCEIPQTGSVSAGAPTSSSAEAERTKKIEAKAAEIERMAQDIQNMTGTEQEKIDAMNRLEQARRELNEMQGQ